MGSVGDFKKTIGDVLSKTVKKDSGKTSQKKPSSKTRTKKADGASGSGSCWTSRRTTALEPENGRRAGRGGR